MVTPRSKGRQMKGTSIRVEHNEASGHSLLCVAFIRISMASAEKGNGGVYLYPKGSGSQSSRL